MDTTASKGLSASRPLWLDVAVLLPALMAAMLSAMFIHFLWPGTCHHASFDVALFAEMWPTLLLLAAFSLPVIWLLARRARQGRLLLNSVLRANQAVSRIAAFNDQQLMNLDYRRVRGLPAYEPVLEEILLNLDGSANVPQSGMLAFEAADGSLAGRLYTAQNGRLIKHPEEISIQRDSGLAVTEGFDQISSNSWRQAGVSLAEFQARFHPSVRAAVGELNNYLTYRIPGKPGGALIFFNYRGQISELEQNMLAMLGSTIGSLAAVHNQLHEREHIQYSSMARLAELAESRDPETGAHLNRMSHYSCLIAREMHRRGLYPEQVDEDFVLDILHCSPLHDIGKVGIEDSVLLKPGRLTPEEYGRMKEHAAIGGKVLQGAEYLELARDIAYYHHERWDGNGYPFGKRGEEIPLCARIVAVADVYDALTSSRVYKAAMEHGEAKRIMIESSGTQFDPEIVDLFFELEDEIHEIRERYNDDGAE